MFLFVMSLSVTAYPFPWGHGVLLLEPIPASSQGKGRVLPGQVASSSQGPHWWAMWGSVSCSKTLRHAAQPCPEPGFELATFRSLVDLLLTSRPALPAELQPPLFLSVCFQYSSFACVSVWDWLQVCLIEDTPVELIGCCPGARPAC